MNSVTRYPPRAKRVAFVLLMAVVLSGTVIATAHATPGTTELASVNSAGERANGGSSTSSISADGRYVAFSSFATNLTPGDTNERFDIFVRDRQNGTTERVSINSSGSQANYHSIRPSISADGRYVVFESGSSNLVDGDTNSRSDIFVHDRQGGITERVSVDSARTQANHVSSEPSISSDGRHIAFESHANNLVANDTNGQPDIFVRDLEDDSTERVSINGAGEQTSSESKQPSISGDGRYVAFQSSSPNLATNDTNGAQDIFVRDRQSEATERVSVNSAGEQGEIDGGRVPSISADGRYVSFESYATNLVDNDTNDTKDIFVRDRQSGATERVSLNGSGEQANNPGVNSSISADGRYVAFESPATNLVAEDTNRDFDVFVRDREGSTTELASVSSAGVQGDRYSGGASISADGHYVAFFSFATNLVANDTSGFTKILVRELGTGNSDTTAPVTEAALSPEPNTTGWHKENPTVTLSATDEEDGSGVREITYSTTGAQEISSETVEGDSAEFSITEEGETTITYFATDKAGNAEESKTLTVKLDKTAPELSCKADPSSIWPPDRKLVDVNVSVSVDDILSGPAGFALTSATSDESDNQGTPTDIEGFDIGEPDTEGQLRAELESAGDGRLYKLSYEGRDVAGNSTSCEARVAVPHDQR